MNYLLEKSRVVCPAKDERNFHIFYYMLRYAQMKDQSMLERYKLKDIRQYYYLNRLLYNKEVSIRGLRIG